MGRGEAARGQLLRLRRGERRRVQRGVVVLGVVVRARRVVVVVVWLCECEVEEGYEGWSGGSGTRKMREGICFTAA
jgi:hypothetical protein